MRPQARDENVREIDAEIRRNTSPECHVGGNIESSERISIKDNRACNSVCFGRCI